MGAMMYFGSDEYIAGQALGKRIATEGGKHALCVSTRKVHRARGPVQGRRRGLKSENMQVNGPTTLDECLDRGQAAAGSVDRLDRNHGCAVALVALDAIGVPAARPRSRHSTSTWTRQCHQGRQDRAGSRRPAVPAGVPGRRVPLALQDQRQRHRRRPVDADRAGDGRRLEHRDYPPFARNGTR